MNPDKLERFAFIMFVVVFGGGALIGAAWALGYVGLQVLLWGMGG